MAFVLTVNGMSCGGCSGSVENVVGTHHTNPIHTAAAGTHLSALVGSDLLLSLVVR